MSGAPADVTGRRRDASRGKGAAWAPGPPSGRVRLRVRLGAEPQVSSQGLRLYPYALFLKGVGVFGLCSSLYGVLHRNEMFHTTLNTIPERFCAAHSFRKRPIKVTHEQHSRGGLEESRQLMSFVRVV